MWTVAHMFARPLSTLSKKRNGSASGRPHRLHRRAPQLGFGDDPPSPPPSDRAGRRNIARRETLGAVPARLLLASAGAIAPVPAALPGRPRRRSRGGPTGVLRRTRQPASPTGLHRASRAARQEELVRLRQAALRRAGGGARLSRPLH